MPAKQLSVKTREFVTGMLRPGIVQRAAFIAGKHLRRLQFDTPPSPCVGYSLLPPSPCVGYSLIHP
jgi:hypothetical protein